jgi:hypothetical protein
MRQASRFSCVLAILAGCASHAQPMDDERTLSGAEEAHADIAAGRLMIRSFGLVGGVDPATSAARERYGIATESVGPCAVDADTAVRATAYNRVMRAEIRRRFGAEVLREADGPATVAAAAKRSG